MSNSEGVVNRVSNRSLPRIDPRLAAGALALVSAGTLLIARVALNAGLVPAFAGSMGTIQLLAVLGPALGAVMLATTTGDEIERVGLAFVGVFGLLVAVVPTVVVGAVVAIAVGGTLAVGRRWRRAERGTDWHLLPVVAIVGAIGISLFGSMGIEPTTLSALGSHLFLLGGAATPALLGHGRADWAFGGVAAAVLVAIGTAAPFVTGAVTLIGGGIVGASLLVLAVGLCGLVTTASAALRRHHWYAAVGAALLIAGGVPATVPRAMAVVLGVLLLVEPRGGVSA
ncbi:MAG: phosphate ABC transporter permease [Halapricum sp.]